MSVVGSIVMLVEDKGRLVMVSADVLVVSVLVLERGSVVFMDEMVDIVLVVDDSVGEIPEYISTYHGGNIVTLVFYLTVLTNNKPEHADTS